ncbi:hypothetical protein DFH07DRAFT_941049 [Mycena maculata]|uniref:Transcription factor domain-containing protein n=1 Tax=Mycena maculata TaxID=230809 RepID=A0AAD7J0A4_9AGAR|nr:hypothetical protein DFH07DRAFT_941049 [Mycena maculata]
MQQTFSANSLSPLQKGKACVNCRRRKIVSHFTWWSELKALKTSLKCDGGRPMCGPCSRYSAAFGDCEYTEGGQSNGQMLEEQISILQARIEELEKPPNQCLTLSMPHASGSRGIPVSAAPISPSNTMGLGSLLSYFYQQQTSGTAVHQNALDSMPTELPFIVLQALVHNFLHNAGCFGFFLDAQAFHDAITGPNGRNLPSVLLNVMYLWGVHLSQDERITAYEPAFLAHALRSTAGSLTGSHPRTILHSAQASVLLAYYFIRNARFLEGKYHTSAAVSIAVCAGLHRIRAAPGSSGFTPTAETLSPPKDGLEEGERINAFWSIVTLNNCWTGTDGSPSNIAYGPDGLTIDTPWPLETRDYVERPHLVPRYSSGSITRFLADTPDDANSSAALHAKAAVLFEAATSLGARYRANGISRNDTELAVLDRKIDVFVAALPTVQSKTMLVVHTLAHAATVQVHNPLAKEHAFARTKAVSAARSIVDILVKTDIPKVGLIDPVLARLWKTTCFVFIAEVTRRRNQGAETQGPTESLNIVIAAMQFFAPHFPIMTEQLESVRKACNAAQMGV